MTHFDKSNRVLVAAPHADDEVHCAGTANKLASLGCEVAAVSFSYCEKSLTTGFSASDIVAEQQESMGIIGIPDELLWTRDFPVREFPEFRQGILEQLVQIRREFMPNVILCPSSTDTHQDHHVVYEECERVWRGHATVLGWLHPLNMRTIHADAFVRLTAEEMFRKLQVWRCYKSQAAKRSGWNEDWMEHLCRVWGVMARGDSDFAEAFEFIGGSIA